MIDIKAQKPAARYAEALFEASLKFDLNQILYEIGKISEEIENNAEFRGFLFHPVVSAADKKEVIKEAFKEFSDITKNFVYILIDEKRVDCLDEIRNFLEEKINKKNKILTLDVTLAINPEEEMKKNIINRLKNKFQSEIKANFIFNPDILGGLQIRIKDTVIDLSVRKRLESFKK